MEKKKRFKMPHAYVIIFIMTVITAILANIIPAGTFDRVEDASGNSVVVADSFHHVDKIGCSIFDMFKSFQIGFEDSAQIIFFIIFAYAFVYVLLKNGTFDALVGSVLRKVGNRIELIIPVCMILFGLLGSTMGMFEETYGLIPVFISIAMALGYDAIVGGSVIYLGVAVGFAAATINPFTIGIAQEVAGVKMFSGLGYRILCFVVFMSISIWYVWRYARRIQKCTIHHFLTCFDKNICNLTWCKSGYKSGYNCHNNEQGCNFVDVPAKFDRSVKKHTNCKYE